MRLCENCGDVLPRYHRRWCSKKECVIAGEAEQRRQMREAWRRTGGTKRNPNKNIPYNPKPCELCKLPLGKTLNHWYHSECHKRASVLQGLECYELNNYRQNGHYVHGGVE
jgi:hypothetical protein